jgi:hypothetical protein
MFSPFLVRDSGPWFHHYDWEQGHVAVDYWSCALLLRHLGAVSRTHP